MNRHLLGKNLDFFLQNSTFFHTNPNDNLKNRCHSKTIVGHVVFQLFFESIFLQLSLLLNNSIRWQWLLFRVIKSMGIYKQVMQLR